MWEYELPSDCAWAISKLFQLRGIYHNSIKVVVGDGRETILFYDCWMPAGILVERSELADHQSRHWKTVKVSDWREEGMWKIPSSFGRRWPGIARQIGEQVCSNQPDKVT